MEIGPPNSACLECHTGNLASRLTSLSCDRIIGGCGVVGGGDIIRIVSRTRRCLSLTHTQSCVCISSIRPSGLCGRQMTNINNYQHMSGTHTHTRTLEFFFLKDSQKRRMHTRLSACLSFSSFGDYGTVTASTNTNEPPKKTCVRAHFKFVATPRPSHRERARTGCTPELTYAH